MANSDYNKQIFAQDGYGNLYPRSKNGSTLRIKTHRTKANGCNNCRVSNGCPAKGEKCNDFIA